MRLPLQQAVLRVASPVTSTGCMLLLSSPFLQTLDPLYRIQVENRAKFILCGETVRIFSQMPYFLERLDDAPSLKFFPKV